MNSTKTTAPTPPAKDVGRGGEQNEANEKMPRAARLSSVLLAPSVCEELETGVRAIVREEARLPAYVSQRNVERWTSVPARDFLAAGRAGEFPTSKVRRVVMAKTEDVLTWIEGHSRKALFKDSGPANDEADELDAALASVGGRRVSR